MKKRREGLSLLTICSWLKDLNISPLGFLRLQDLGLKCASLPHNKTSWEIKTSGLYYVFITLWNSSHLNSFCTDCPSGWCKSRLEGNLEMSLTLPVSSTVLWIQVRFLKSSSLLFSEQEAQIQPWRVGQLSWCVVALGSHWVTWLKKLLSDSFLAEHGLGQEGEEFVKILSSGLKEVWQNRVPAGLPLLLRNTWRTYDVVGTSRCLYSADLKYKYLSTFLNCPMSFYNMLVAIFDLFPTFKVIKEEIKTFQA